MLNAIDITWRRACAAAIATLPAFGPGRIGIVLSDMPPEVAWASLGEEGSALEGLRRTTRADTWTKYRTSVLRAVRRTDPMEVLERYESQGISVWTPMGEYPSRLIADPAVPLILFGSGDTSAFDQPTVAIIGTRQCSIEGRRTAEYLGRSLAEAGVTVVSGLALGIDAAAHVGALDARNGSPPIGVVGSGLDVIYPRRNAGLWGRMLSEGLVISESPLGAPAERWRFPARNRIIAGLADLVVVVESHDTGGSLLTVNEAESRGRQVMAVPGSINSPASRGTNLLLRDGCAPVCSVDDVLTVLSLTPSKSSAVPMLPAVEGEAEAVLEAVDWQPTTTDEVMQRTELPLGEVATILMNLQQGGYLIGMGGWWQRIAEVTTDYECG